MTLCVCGLYPSSFDPELCYYRATMDPWMITPDERAMHAGQFGSLNPASGFIDGNGARGFFMQSGLPPMVLAQVGNSIG